MELVVLSGKGGTGKTTIATALGELAEHVVKVDCDVDAPNLYLLCKGKDINKEGFSAGKKAVINSELCRQCGKCSEVCRFSAIEDFKVNSLSCEGCGACTLVCPYNAITLEDEKTADIYVTETSGSLISRAEMGIGTDGSGKLINALRRKGKEINKNNELIIVDGSPGIGCPVMSSITGSNAVLIVTEPTKSGLEDLKRVAELCSHFRVPAMVCINKFDINKENTEDIEEYAVKNKLKIVGKIPYDDMVMKSINELMPITYYKESKAEKEIEIMWSNIKTLLNI